MAPPVRNLSVGLYGAVMGLEGLGLASRGAAAVLPVPAAFAEIWVWLGIVALALLLPAYVAKLARYPQAVREEFTHPAQLGFCGALPVGMTLVGGGLAPYAYVLADAVWWAGVVLLFSFQVWALARLLGGGIEISQLNGGWLIILVGGIVVPSGGIALGHAEASAFMFGLSTAVAPFVLGLVLYRTIAAPLPEGLRPTWFIFLVPPSLIYANGAALAGGAGVFLEGVFFIALPLALALLIAARRFLSWPFGAPWWAFTFPLDALAAATVHHAGAHPSTAWRAVAALALGVAVFFAVVVLGKTVSALARGTFFAAVRRGST
jgi:tellurite resistance protein